MERIKVDLATALLRPVDPRRGGIHVAVRFSSISVIEILDSRGQPTLSVSAVLADGRQVRSGVPSGASTGSREGVELGDHDERYGGLSVLRAVALINGAIAEALTGQSFGALDEIDQTFIEDGIGEHDTTGWRRPTETLGDQVQLVATTIL